MRHVTTLLAALVVAPLGWIALAFGQDRAGRAITDVGGEDVAHAGDVVRALLVLAVAGLLLGLIASLRVSPVGATVTGAAYLASYASLLLAPAPVLDAFTRNLSVAGRHADLSIPLRTGTAALLGAMLLVAVVSVGRWRRWPDPSEPAEAPARELGAEGLSPDVPFPGNGPNYESRSPRSSHTQARISDPSWPDTLRNSGPR